MKRTINYTGDVSDITNFKYDLIENLESKGFFLKSYDKLIHQEYDIIFETEIINNTLCIYCGLATNPLRLEVDESDKHCLLKFLKNLKEAKLHIDSVIRTIKISNIIKE